MKTYLYAFAAVAAIAAAAAPASAEGFRAEIHGGWDHARADDAGNNDGESGIVYGIGAGYDFAISPKVELGLDLSADLSTVDECETGVVVPGDRACIDAGRDLAAAV